jgi:L-lactate dehydrogenase complex protein LldG
VSDVRAEILGRIRSAIADVELNARHPRHPVAREYERERHDPEALDHLAERLADYRARVERIDRARVGELTQSVAAELGLKKLVVAAGVPSEWRPDGPELVDEQAVTDGALDQIDGVLTGCAVAIAETGTIVLDGGPRCGRRAITLVPDHHICVVEAEQVVALVPEAFARVEPAVRERRAPITLISGPSATSDIELKRVEGVHGPRHLVVVLAQPDN